MPTSREPLIEERPSSHGVVALTMRHGRLNTLVRPLRTELLDALDRAEHDESVRAVVLRGDGVFSAGAELTEFDSGQGLAEPSLHATIADFLDEMSTPVVAAIEGMALGGGLELALACHYRVATPDATLGLPEVTFGFLPGAGGTQRLPRALGVTTGLDLMLQGTSVRAADVEGTALVAALLGEDPLADAVAFAAGVAGDPVPRLRDVALRDDDAEAFLSLAARSVRGDEPRAAIVAAVAAGLDDVDQGFAQEQRLFRELADTEGASARRHLFLAERAARRRPKRDGAGAADAVKPPAVRVGVVGGGTMGRGIALAHALAGLQVVVVETDAERRDAAERAIAADAERTARSSRKPGRRPVAADELVARIACTTELADLRDADLVIEAVPEIMALKRDVFTRLDALLPSGAVLATNTSSLDVDEIAATTSRPEDVVGLHFFSPAHVMRLLEIVRGSRTSPATLAFALSHAEALAKVPVVSGVAPGFIGNRIQEASSREVGLMLLEGATPSQIDGALERWGMRMGPLRVLDLVGNDVPMLTRRATGTADALEWAPAAALVERGRLGVKTGRGWYRYDDGSAQHDTEVIEMVADLARAAGVAPREHTDREIVERAVLSMVGEGAAVLDEGVAARAGDIDVVFAHGYGFPSGRGGPMHFADTLGLRNVVRIMDRYARRAGGDHWAPHPLITQRAHTDEPLARWEAAG
jgi:3-hydroxyacyl-CoA dehydrogenase